jgi:hypothetical protein
MRALLTISFLACGVCVAHAEPGKVRQSSSEELSRVLVAKLLSDQAAPTIKGQPALERRVELVKSETRHTQAELAFRGLTREKMKLTSRSAKGSTLIRVGYRKCARPATCPPRPIR